MTTVKTESEISQAKLLNGFIEGNIGKAHVLLTQYEEALPFLENGIGILNEQHKVIYRAEIFENTLYLALAHMELGNLHFCLHFRNPGISLGLNLLIFQ